ncbi:MAG: hypothetical protein LRZ84_14390 [Desertifilum sp.]|nr:hypothetical protein [Desertifilum sp.]
MSEILFTSKKFPGIALYCPVRPDTGQPGTFHFDCGIKYAVEPETVVELKRQLESSPNPVKSAITLQVYSHSVINPAVKTAIPPEPAFSSDLDDEDDEEELISEPLEPFELNEEDEDLIEIEVSKLKNKTVAQAEPLLTALALNNDLHVELRKLYLNRVLGEPTLQKRLKDAATEALELLQ